MQALRDELTRAGATEHEAAELAALLQRAAEPARFDVTPAEVESALAHARPARRRLPRVALAVPALAAALLVLVLVLPSRQGPVQARALGALGGDDTLLHMKQSVFTRLPGSSGTTTRDVWYDASRGRARWVDYGQYGDEIAETLVTPSRFDRLLPIERVHLYGRTCTAVAAGCAQVLDPVARYRAMLRRTTREPVRTVFGGRPAYRFEFALLPRLDQLVYVDRQTLLPRTIIWREHDASGVHVVATIEITDVERVSRDDAPPKIFARPVGGRPVRVVPAGRVVDAHPLRRRRARGAYWVGPRGLHGFSARRYERGTAIVARYDDFEVWSYGRAAPPELLAPRFAQTKTVELGGRPITFFAVPGRVALVRDGSPSVAITGVTSKEELFDAMSRVRRLR